jgi:hypothetical protein
MKTFLLISCLVASSLLVYSQQASDYFPSQTGFEWKLKSIPLDSVSNPINALAYFRIDSFATIENYEGKLANIVLTKSGPLDSILLKPYLDSLFYHTDGTNGFEYFSIRNIEEFLIQLDELGIDPNFSFLEFFTSLQNWYDVYRFASGVGTDYTLLQVDTSITYNSNSIPIQFKYLGTRLPDQTIQTVLGNYDCKRFVLQWKVNAYTVIPLLTLSDTIWIAQGNWIVQDIIPGQYVDNLNLLGIEPFSILGLETKLTDEIVSIESDGLIANTFILEQNYPNPFNPSTKIEFSIQDFGFVSLKVYDILGNEVATLVNSEKPAGVYELEWNAGNVPSGVYFYQLKTEDFVETKKMILMK